MHRTLSYDQENETRTCDELPHGNPEDGLLGVRLSISIRALARFQPARHTVDEQKILYDIAELKKSQDLARTNFSTRFSIAQGPVWPVFFAPSLDTQSDIGLFDDIGRMKSFSKRIVSYSSTSHVVLFVLLLTFFWLLSLRADITPTI
jgi:hypothetical protein